MLSVAWIWLLPFCYAETTTTTVLFFFLILSLIQHIDCGQLGGWWAAGSQSWPLWAAGDRAAAKGPDEGGIRTHARRAQWISSPSPSPLGHLVPCSSPHLGIFFSLWSTGCKPTDAPPGCPLYSWAVGVGYVPACCMAGGKQGSGSFLVHLSLSISPSVPVFRGWQNVDWAGDGLYLFLLKKCVV